MVLMMVCRTARSARTGSSPRELLMKAASSTTTRMVAATMIHPFRLTDRTPLTLGLQARKKKEIAAKLLSIDDAEVISSRCDVTKVIAAALIASSDAA